MSDPQEEAETEAAEEAVTKRMKTRSRLGRGPWILAALAALVWMAQGAVTWFVIGHSCPSGERQWSLGAGRWVAFAVTLAALAITVGAIARSVSALKSTEAVPEGRQHPTLGETMTEQRRFTAMVGLLAGACLTLGVVFATISTLVIRVCGETR